MARQNTPSTSLTNEIRMTNITSNSVLNISARCHISVNLDTSAPIDNFIAHD